MSTPAPESTSAILARLRANSSTKKGARLSSTKTYTIHTDGDVAVGFAPQAIALIAIMFEEDENSWTEQELHDVISIHTDISVKQKPWSVFKYYRKVLVDSGFLSVSD